MERKSDLQIRSILSGGTSIDSERVLGEFDAQNHPVVNANGVSPFDKEGVLCPAGDLFIDTVRSVNGDIGISLIPDDEVAEIGHGGSLLAILNVNGWTICSTSKERTLSRWRQDYNGQDRGCRLVLYR